MDANFWHQKWRSNAIGFHNRYTHELLEDYYTSLLHPNNDTNILVPLCGKSVDMMLLRNHAAQVHGVELSSLACNAFFAEQQLDYQRFQDDCLIHYQHHNLHIWNGDFFAYQGTHNSYYDRAALIALPSTMQQAYVTHLNQLLTANAKGLLIALEHQNTTDGPPFNVTEETVHALFEPQFTVIQLAVVQTTSPFGESYETAYQLQKH